eukprot:Seg984.8 transcript_id=Seg984.8/GoldUCD/mRNA.D3Y31 product="hypothetical protein" protein_id=Seg984.8/GoldUCD/D3Y31
MILKGSLEKANAENFKTCSDSCKLENELERLHDENERQKSRILQLETNLERKNAEQVNIVEMCKTLEDKLAKRNEACANLALAKGEEQQDFQEKMDEMTKNYNKVSQLSENLAARFKDQESISKKAMEEIEGLQAQLKTATQSNTKYKARSKILISKMEKINKKQKELQLLNKIKQENSNLKAEMAILQENLSKEIPLRKSNQKAVFTLKQELERYEQIYIASQEKVKELEQNQNNYMASENQYRNIIKRLQRNLTETRHELKLKTKEDAELQKLQLITEFEMSNCQRLTNERENELKIKQQREELLFKRNLELEAEMKELRYQLHLKSKDGSFSERSDFDERVFVNQMVTRLRLSRKKFDETKDQFINNDFMQIKQLQQKLKSKDDKYKRAQIELNVMKDELERVKQQQQQPNGVAKKQLPFDLDESYVPDIGI